MCEKKRRSCTDCSDMLHYWRIAQIECWITADSFIREPGPRVGMTTIGPTNINMTCVCVCWGAWRMDRNGTCGFKMWRAFLENLPLHSVVDNGRGCSTTPLWSTDLRAQIISKQTIGWLFQLGDKLKRRREGVSVSAFGGLHPPHDAPAHLSLCPQWHTSDDPPSWSPR